MHKFTGSSLAVGSLCALLGALACSSEPSGGSDNSNNTPFGSSPNNAAGASSNPNQPSQQMPGVVGSGGTEGQANPSLSTGGSTSLGAGGSTGMTAPVVDEPP